MVFVKSNYCIHPNFVHPIYSTKLGMYKKTTLLLLVYQ